MNNNTLLTIRLPGDLRSQLESIAERDLDTPSSIARKALQLYMIVRQGGTEADQRKQFSSEYVFLALNRWMAKTLPEEHDALLDDAQRRTEALYAAS